MAEYSFSERFHKVMECLVECDKASAGSKAHKSTRASKTSSTHMGKTEDSVKHASSTDDTDLPDLDDEVNRLGSQRTMSLRTRNIGKSDDSNLPLTPTATPSKTSYPGSRFTPINLRTPTKFRRPPKDTIVLTPMTAPERPSKRKSIHCQGSEDEDTETDMVTPSKKARTVDTTSRPIDGSEVTPIASIITSNPFLTTPPPSQKRKHTINHQDNDDETIDDDDGHIVQYIKRSRTTYSSSSSTSPSPSPSPFPSNPYPDISAEYKSFNINTSTICNTPPAPNPRIPILSSFEAKRVRSSILKQIKWDKVAEDVACNRSSRVYKRAVMGMLDTWVAGAVVGERMEG